MSAQVGSGRRACQIAGRLESPNVNCRYERTRQVIVSSIVDVDAISPDDSQRITTLIMAGLNSRRGEQDYPRVDSLYDADRGRLRIMITASRVLTCELVRTIGALAEDTRG